MQKALVFLVLSTVLLAACSSPQANTGSGADETESSGDTLLDVLDDAGIDIDPVLREIMELEEKRANAEFMVAYTTTMTNNGETIDMSMTEYRDGPTKTRTDTEMADFGESRQYVLGDRYISCTKFTGTWRCEEYVATDEEYDFEDSSDVPEVDTTWEEEEVEDVTFERDGTMQVAGVTAQCYKADFAGLVSRQCYSDLGVTLFMTTSDAEGGTMEIKATSYKESTAAADFEPPATPVDSSSPEAQDADCRDACVMLDMSESECDDFCSMQQTYEAGDDGAQDQWDEDYGNWE